MNPPPERNSRKRCSVKRKDVLIDSSSMILLYKSGLLPDVYRHYNLLATPSVQHETSCCDKPGAQTFARLFQSGEITPLPEREQTAPSPETERLLSLGPGERETLLFFLHGKGDFILLDDLKAIQFCRAGEIPFINTLLLPRILLLSGKIDRARCDLLFLAITALGRYSPKIIQQAASLKSGELQQFFP